MKGHFYQCYREPGRRPNQHTRTTNKIKAEFSKEHNSTHLIETMLREDENECKDLDDPEDEASRTQLVRWELGMRYHHENEKIIKEVLFSTWSCIVGQSSELATTKLKVLNEYKERENKIDCKWLLDNLDRIINKIESSIHPIKCVVDSRRN